MSRYLVTVSWFDPQQPLRRMKETLTVDIDNTSELQLYDITRVIEQENWRAAFVGQDFAIDFMMKMGD